MTLKASKLSHAESVTKDPRWQVLIERDSKADGVFYYSVATTGIYCRPSCSARLPRPENVAFYYGIDEAEAAGFRPCKRCRPKDPQIANPHLKRITQACRLIERSARLPKLEALAEAVGLSKFHFHRLFKSSLGLTPHEYGKAVREERVRRSLRNAASVTDAIFDAGYNSCSRFYEHADKVLGMKADEYRTGAQNEMIRFTITNCRLGKILIATSDSGICAITLGDKSEDLQTQLLKRFPHAECIKNDHAFGETVEAVIRFIEQPQLGLDFPLDIRGTAFQQRVWRALTEIPAGKTASYADIAKRIGAPSAHRAVAQACAKNEIAVAIPCHRVVRADGSLSGYRWGKTRKQKLLALESEDSIEAD